MKRVLIFSLAYYPQVSGAEITVKEITDRIPPADIEFHMVTLRFSPSDAWEEKIGNVTVHRIGSGASYFSKMLFIPHAALAAAHLHAQHRFDALWALMSYMALPVALLRLGGIRLPYVLTLQDGDPFEHVFSRLRILPFRPLLTKGFREATVVQVISNYLGGWAKRMGFAGPIQVIPNGVDVVRFAGERASHEGTRLITTSRLVAKNAVDVGIRALKLLPETVQLEILGSGVEENNLQRLTKELGLGARVHFLGNIPNAELPKYLHAADIFVRPSRSEGMGISFIEAMAVGLPVVATQEGGIADFLFDATRNPERPTTGWAVDKDAPEQIAQAVEDILRNPGEVQRVIQNAKTMVQEKYDWNLITKDMQEKVFGKVLKTS